MIYKVYKMEDRWNGAGRPLGCYCGSGVGGDGGFNCGSGYGAG